MSRSKISLGSWARATVLALLAAFLGAGLLVALARGAGVNNTAQAGAALVGILAGLAAGGWLIPSPLRAAYWRGAAPIILIATVPRFITGIVIEDNSQATAINTAITLPMIALWASGGLRFKKPSDSNEPSPQTPRS